MQVLIGADRARLKEIATELLKACDSDSYVDVVIYGKSSRNLGVEVTIGFSNDDMENRENDFPASTVLIDIEE